MKNEIKMKFFSELTTSKVMRALLYVLIFFQPFNHFNSFREISFYGLLALFIYKIAKRDVKHIYFTDKTVLALFLLFAWSALSSIYGPFPGDSLDALRKNLFKEAVIFLVIIEEFRGLRDIKPLLWTVVLSFAAVTCASIAENMVKDWEAFSSLKPQVSWRSVSTYFFANYSDNGTFYLPFIACWVIAINEAQWKKWVGAGTLMVGSVLVYIYNARTQMITILFAVFVIVFLAKRYKLVAVFVIAAVLGLSIIATSKNDGLSRYRTLLDPETYVTDKGLSNRLGLWQVVIEFIEERPLTGYGYGWKKLAWLVREKDSEEYWEQHPRSARSYFLDDATLTYGRSSPHNLPLQIIFEIGLIGFLIYLWLWGTVLRKMFESIKASTEDSQGRLFVLSGIGVIVSFAMVNVTNSLWQENFGMMIFLFMASVFVIHRETV